jgi:hypothetical protein
MVTFYFLLSLFLLSNKISANLCIPHAPKELATPTLPKSTCGAALMKNWFGKTLTDHCVSASEKKIS